MCDGDGYVDNCINSDSCENMDCTGECFGSAFLDDCGVCSGGTSGHISNNEMDECGVCFTDFDCYGSDCEFWNESCGGCMDPNALNYDPDAILPAGECEYLGDIYISLDGDDESGDGLPGAPFRSIQKRN